jgi:hypothetical protein
MRVDMGVGLPHDQPLKLLEGNPTLMRLRELEVLEKVIG